MCEGNLLTNPGFESLTSKYNPIGDPVPSGWRIDSGYAGATTYYHPPEGSRIGYVGVPGTGWSARMSQEVPVTSGKSYRLTFFSGTHQPWDKPTIELRFYNWWRQEIGLPATHVITTDIDKTGRLGGPYALTGKAPYGAAYAKVILRDAVGHGAGAKADALCLTEGQSAPSNIALNKPAIASSTDAWYHDADYATDGDTDTRWSSRTGDPQWIYVDLEDDFAISKVVLKWSSAYAWAYRIQISSDGQAWTTIHTTYSGNGGTDTVNVYGAGRYVRMYGLESVYWNYGLTEFEVYGMP